MQDCRGTGASEGEFLPFNEGEDGYDTVEWVASRPWSDGKVGMLGGSYHGSTQWAAAKEQPPHLNAIFPGMISPGLRDFIYVGGPFQLQAAMQWGLFMSLLRLPRETLAPEALAAGVGKLMKASDNMNEMCEFLPLKEQSVLKEVGLAPFYFEWLDHPDHDEAWEASTYALFEKTTVPAHLITGWYDTLLKGTLSCYKGLKERGGSEQARENVKIIIGPWDHSIDLSQQVGDVDFGILAAGSTVDVVNKQLRWFDYWLKGEENEVLEEAPVRIFVMGQNVWRDEKEWPLTRAQYRKYYFHSDGMANSLRGDGTLSTQSPEHEEYDIYTYDPRNPVPTLGGSILSRTGRAGPFDQTLIEERSDVLVYTTPPLEEDLEITGPITLTLFSASSPPTRTSPPNSSMCGRMAGPIF